METLSKDKIHKKSVENMFFIKKLIELIVPEKLIELIGPESPLNDFIIKDIDNIIDNIIVSLYILNDEIVPDITLLDKKGNLDEFIKKTIIPHLKKLEDEFNKAYPKEYKSH